MLRRAECGQLWSASSPRMERAFPRAARWLGLRMCFRRDVAGIPITFTIRTHITDSDGVADWAGADFILVICSGAATDMGTAMAADMDFMVEALAATTVRT